MYQIEFVKPVILEGREYHPYSLQDRDRCYPVTATGRQRRFMSMGAAMAWAREPFNVAGGNLHWVQIPIHNSNKTG